jgi:predicted MPP superfamily phosphohydrolase
LEIGGETVRLVGIDDAALGLDDLPTALPPQAQGHFEILLSHSPDGVLHPQARRIRLALSGHTHGGQIRIPGYGAPVRHARAVDRTDTAGLMRIGRTQCYVSRGFGTAAIPFRLGARPELGVIELRAAEPSKWATTTEPSASRLRYVD